MGIPNLRRNELLRLQAKTLDGRFQNILTEGLDCSPFEAQAVIAAVREVYFPFLDEAASSAPPGKIALLAVSADEPSGKPIADCAQQTVCLTLHRGADDDRLLQTRGPDGCTPAGGRIEAAPSVQWHEVVHCVCGDCGILGNRNL